MLNIIAILIGRITRRLVRVVRPGGGSALPGLVVSKIAPGLLAKVWNEFPGGVVVVTGSAGKSSTTKMLVAIARAHGLLVFTNPTTANILQGFYSSILERSSWRGKVPGQVAILEVDEGHAAEILKNVSARYVTVLNVTEDQLDRFVDPAIVREKLLAVALSAREGVILNADDQNLLWLAHEGGDRLAETSYFGLSQTAKENKYLGFAETYLPPFENEQPSTWVESAEGREVIAKSGGRSVSLLLPNRGIHYAADTVAAFETARRLLGSKFDLELAARTVELLPPVFARGEITNIRGHEVELILVQNPASFQMNLDALDDSLDAVMIAIGRDVHDPAWLWTVDYSKLEQVLVVTGFNAFEMALCLTYRDLDPEYVTDDLEKALDKFFELSKDSKSRRTILLSADAMRRYRRMLGFVSPEMVGLT